MAEEDGLDIGTEDGKSGSRRSLLLLVLSFGVVRCGGARLFFLV